MNYTDKMGERFLVQMSKSIPVTDMEDFLLSKGIKQRDNLE